MRLCPQVLQSTQQGFNYTLLLSVMVYEAGAGTRIINNRTTITLLILESPPVIRMTLAGLPVIVRRHSSVPVEEAEPLDIDASYSYDPDGGGVCFRWECRDVC